MQPAGQCNTFDELAKKILPIAERRIANKSKPMQQPTTETNLRIDQKDIQHYQQVKQAHDKSLAQLQIDIARIKKVEKDQDKLDFLHDAGLYIEFMQWSSNRSEQSTISFAFSTAKAILWHYMPRALIDNRMPSELAKDLIAKSEKINQKHQLPDSKAVSI